MFPFLMVGMAVLSPARPMPGLQSPSLPSAAAPAAHTQTDRTLLRSLLRHMATDGHAQPGPHISLLMAGPVAPTCRSAMPESVLGPLMKSPSPKYATPRATSSFDPSPTHPYTPHTPHTQRASVASTHHQTHMAAARTCSGHVPSDPERRQASAPSGSASVCACGCVCLYISVLVLQWRACRLRPVA